MRSREVKISREFFRFAARQSRLVIEGGVACQTEILKMKFYKDSYFCESLYHLRRNGWIDRIRRGLYSLSCTVYEVAPVHDFETAMNLASPAAISCWSAMNFYGFTDQIPGRVVVMSTTDGIRTAPAKVWTQVCFSGRLPCGSGKWIFPAFSLTGFLHCIALAECQ